MDLLPNPEQQQIADSIADFLSAEAPAARFLEPGRDHTAAERALWADYAALEWFGLGLSEDLGGVGATAAEDALLFREVGRHLASPNLLAARIGAEAAARAGDAASARAILSGETVAVLAIPAGPRRIGPMSAGRFHLLDADPGDLSVTWSDDGVALLPTDSFDRIEVVPGLDDGVTLSTAERGDRPVQAWLPSDVHPLPMLAAVLTAAMCSGVAEAVLSQTLEHVRFREQFGRPIGAFQAVKHRCADMAVGAEAAWAQCVMAALAFTSRKPTAGFEAAAARLIASLAALDGAAACIQLHGGLGFTAESSAHLFMKRARLLEQIGGPPMAQRGRLLSRALLA